MVRKAVEEERLRRAAEELGNRERQRREGELFPRRCGRQIMGPG
jgi:hypothetical protein